MQLITEGIVSDRAGFNFLLTLDAKLKHLLRHSFPVLGQVEVPLHEESAATFRLMERLPMAGTQFWQGQDHLGELRTVLKCGHHSRYEYLMLQLYLIHFFKEKARGFGLSSRISIAPHLQVSSAEELLKCWAFLEEFGHLRGTYEAERFLLDAFTARPAFADYFISAFENPKGVEFAKRIVAEEDLQGLHRAISWLALEVYGRGQKYKTMLPQIAFSLEALNALVDASDDEPLLRARSYFSRIRQLAHMYLDMANLPTYVHFHPAIFLQKISSDPSSFLDDDSEATRRLISGILDYLQDEIYSSSGANKYKLERCEGLNLNLERCLSVPRKSPIRSRKRFVGWMLAAKGAEFWGYRPAALRREHRLRLRFVSDGYFAPESVKQFSEARIFSRNVNSSRWSSIITSYKTPLGHSCFFDLFEADIDAKPAEGKVATALLDFLKTAYFRHRHVAEVFNWLCEERLADIFKYLLGRVISRSYEIRFDKTGRFSDFKIDMIEFMAMRSKWSRSVAWRLKKSHMGADRKWEVDCLRREIRQAARGRLLISTSSVVVEDERHRCVAEFDGVFVRINKGLLEVNFVEAKNTNKGGRADAVRSLTEKLVRLNVQGSAGPVIGKARYATVSIRL